MRINFWTLRFSAGVEPVHARNGDGVIMDIQTDKEDNVHVAFLSLFELTTKPCGSAFRHMWAPNPRSRKADTLARPMANHSD